MFPIYFFHVFNYNIYPPSWNGKIQYRPDVYMFNSLLPNLNDPNDKHVTLHEYHNASNFKLHFSTQDLHDSRVSFRHCKPPYVRTDMKLYCINCISTDVVRWLVAFVLKNDKFTEPMQIPFINTKSWGKAGRKCTRQYTIYHENSCPLQYD
jgi:hypothetical protein